MIEIHVQLYSVLREKLPAEAQGRAVLKLDEPATLADLLGELDINRRVVISVNGRHEPEYSRRLRDQDEVKIFSSVGGGAQESARECRRAPVALEAPGPQRAGNARSRWGAGG